MKKWKKFLIQVIIFELYLTGVALIGYGLLEIWKPIAFIFFGVVSVYIGLCVFNILEDMK